MKIAIVPAGRIAAKPGVPLHAWAYAHPTRDVDRRLAIAEAAARRWTARRDSLREERRRILEGDC